MNNKIFSEDDSFITPMQRMELSRIKMVMESRNADVFGYLDLTTSDSGHSEARLWKKLGLTSVRAENE